MIEELRNLFLEVLDLAEWERGIYKWIWQNYKTRRNVIGRNKKN